MNKKAVWNNTISKFFIVMMILVMAIGLTTSAFGADAWITGKDIEGMGFESQVDITITDSGGQPETFSEETDAEGSFRYVSDMNELTGEYQIHVSDGSNEKDMTLLANQIQLYSDAGHTQESYLFESGATVYAKIPGINLWASVFVWKDENDNTVRTSNCNSGNGPYYDQYTLTGANPGTWSVERVYYNNDACTSYRGTETTEFEVYEIVPNPSLAQSCGIDIAVVFDGSGSIDSSEYSDMQDAFVEFVNSFLPNTPTEMAIVEFASTAVLRQGFTSDATTLINEINEARVQPGGQYTNWEQGLVVTQGQFPNRAKPDLVVFASDGNPNRIGDPPSTANAQDATLAAVAVANQLKQDGVRIITLGIGNDVDADNLIAISSADAYYESDFDDLAQDLADIADDLCGGTITVRKLVDGQPAENWEFTAEVCCGGTVTPTTGYTDNNGYAVFDVEVTSTSAYVDITETLMDGYDFVSASCNDGHSIPGDLTVTEIDVYPDSQIYCEFLNTAVECETDDDCAPDNNYCDGDNWVHYSESCINGECLPASSTASCDDGLYCNGDETCEGAGVCTNPADIVCDTPPGPCYEPLGECNEQTDTCVYDYDDTQGPVTSNLAVTPSFNNGIFNVTALATDECTNIEESEFFVGHMGGAHCESPGTGTPMAAFDGNFDELIEDVIAVDANYIVDGLNWACVQSKDVADNWGNCVCTYFETDTIPPICPFDMRIDGSGPNPQEFLICGDEPMVTGHVCDDQSGIQGGEYFIDPTIPPVPPPWSGYWMDINFTYSNPETGMLCTQIMAQLNTTGLQDGTHYIKMRGKDLVENWGKIQFCPSMSFIRDTTPPIVSKELFPAGGVSVGCDIQEMNGHQITAGCEYVKTGTQIELSAHDPDPQGTGEFAGDVIIHYKVWYSYDGSSWTLQQQGQSQPDENVTITLTEDSYHLVEFWATDGCSLSTEHYFELDIVDNQAPEIIKTITGPQLDGEAPIHKYLTSESVISLECSDVEPHPVGGEQLVWAMYWSYNDLNNWQFINSGTDMDGYKEFTDLSDSYHRFVYYCVDALGNTGQDQTEIDAVDNTPPVTTENITGPVYFDGYNTYLDAATRIHLTCNDPEPHPVGGETIYYRYFLDGNMVINWTQYTGEFGFPEESEHELQYYCVDALNNKETTHIETYLVDHTPPITDSSFGTPYYTNGVSEWINFQTPITLTASEPDAPCQSGFKETWYKDVIVDNSYCADPATYCQPVGEDVGTWQLYTEPIYKTEESCHILQYYSVDNVDKTEEMNYRCFYVQNSTPESWKEVGDPKVPYGDPADGNFYVTQNTPISLFCEETGPHPTGNYTIWYAWFLNTPGGDADGDADGDALAFIQWMKYVGPFTYPTDSNHTLLWYCEDALGNREETNYEIDIVDTVPPNTWKVLGTPKKECTPDEKAMYGINDCWYINQNTLVELFCQDPQPHPVDNVEMHYTIEWKENWGDNWQIIGTGTAGDYYNFTYANDSFHRLTWYCEDALGNTGATFEELDIVDTQAPTLTKEVGDPKVIKECPEIG